MRAQVEDPEESGRPAPPGSTTPVDLDLRPANDWRFLKAVRGPQGSVRWILVALAFGLAVLALLLLAALDRGVPSGHWGTFQFLDLLVVPLGLGGGLFLLRPPRRYRLAETLYVGPDGFGIRFSDGSRESQRWDDPRLEVSVTEISGLPSAPERVVNGLFAEGWRGPALITDAARELLLAEAQRRGLSLGTTIEENPKGRRRSILLRAAQGAPEGPPPREPPT